MCYLHNFYNDISRAILKFWFLKSHIWHGDGRNLLLLRTFLYLPKFSNTYFKDLINSFILVESSTNNQWGQLWPTPLHWQKEERKPTFRGDYVCSWLHLDTPSFAQSFRSTFCLDREGKFNENLGSVSLSSICSSNYIINWNFSNNKKLDEGSDYKPIILELSKNNGKGSKIAIRPFSWDTPYSSLREHKNRLKA